MRMQIFFWLTAMNLLVVTPVFSQINIQMIQQIQDNFIESDLINEVSYIALQYERIETIKPDMELKTDGDNYFILDSKQTQNVYRYNALGELLNTITTQKQATGSADMPVLNNPVKFNINPYKDHVEIFNFENSSLSRFSYDGKKIDQIIFPLSPSDFIRDSKGDYWIYTGWNNKESQFRIIHTDQSGKVIDKHLRLITKCTPFESYAFSSFKNTVYFWELIGNSVYKIENSALNETFRFNYGPKTITDAFHSMNAYDSYQMINRNGFYSIKKYLENERLAYFFLNFNTETSKENFHLIYDKKNSKLFKYREDAAAGLDKAQALTENDELIFLAAPRNLKRILTNPDYVIPESFTELAEESGAMKNVMILKVKIVLPE